MGILHAIQQNVIDDGKRRDTLGQSIGQFIIQPLAVTINDAVLQAPFNRLRALLRRGIGGFAAGTREAKNRGELARFLDSPRVEVVPVTAQTADSYALVYSGLRRKGQPPSCGARAYGASMRLASMA